MRPKTIACIHFHYDFVHATVLYSQYTGQKCHHTCWCKVINHLRKKGDKKKEREKSEVQTNNSSTSLLRNMNRYHVVDVNYLKYIYTCSIQQHLKCIVCAGCQFFKYVYYCSSRSYIRACVCIIVKPSFAYATLLSFDHSPLSLVFNGRHMELDDREEEEDGALDAQIFTPPRGLFRGIRFDQ